MNSDESLTEPVATHITPELASFSRFLQLPLELRSMVYEHNMDNELVRKPVRLQFSPFLPNLFRPLFHAGLLLTSHQVNEEYSDVLIKKAVLPETPAQSTIVDLHFYPLICFLRWRSRTYPDRTNMPTLQVTLNFSDPYIKQPAFGLGGWLLWEEYRQEPSPPTLRIPVAFDVATMSESQLGTICKKIHLHFVHHPTARFQMNMDPHTTRIGVHAALYLALDKKWRENEARAAGGKNGRKKWSVSDQRFK